MPYIRITIMLSVSGQTMSNLIALSPDMTNLVGSQSLQQISQLLGSMNNCSNKFLQSPFILCANRRAYNAAVSSASTVDHVGLSRNNTMPFSTEHQPNPDHWGIYKQSSFRIDFVD